MYLQKYHHTEAALILVLDHHIPAYLQYSEHTPHIILQDLVDINSQSFKLDYKKIGALLPAQQNITEGFSEGYRTAYFKGIEYHFTLLQAEIIEIMDQANKPLHQSEILSRTTSEQIRLASIFRSKGKYHSAWGKIIKNDRKGNYWLDVN